MISYHGRATPAKPPTWGCPLLGLAGLSEMGGVSWAHPRDPEAPIHRSRLRYASHSSPQPQAAVKLHGVFSPGRGCLDCSPGLWIRRAGGWDRGALVNPFMHVGTYPTRHLATLRESQLPPPFGRASPRFVPGASPPPTGQDSRAVLRLTPWPPAMFLLNSRDPLVTATRGLHTRGHPFYRRYGANYPEFPSRP